MSMEIEVARAYTCETCGKSFERPMQLQGHRTSHNVPKPCGVCGKEYKTKGALGNHMVHQHGQTSANSLRKTRPDLDWTADDIFQSVVAIIWPGGVIPVGSVLPLIQWREDTQTMLEKIQHG